MSEGRSPSTSAAMKPAVQRALFVCAALVGAVAVYAVLDFTLRAGTTSRGESPLAPYQTGFVGR